MTLYSKFETTPDETLVRAAVDGQSGALDALVERYQAPMYHLARGMLYNTDDAHDAAQEILIKLITNLGQFRGESSFKTWAYRVGTNHLLRERQKAGAERRLTFQNYGAIINSAPDNDIFDDPQFSGEGSILAEEAKRMCIQGMLMCFSPEQRVVFLLGAVFDLSSSEAAEILSITPENFRKQLSRAKADLAEFTQGQCGLVDPKNPCRCPKKTRAMIDKGMVDPKNLKFNKDQIQMARDAAGQYPIHDERWMKLFQAMLEESDLDFKEVRQALKNRARDADKHIH